MLWKRKSMIKNKRNALATSKNQEFWDTLWERGYLRRGFHFRKQWNKPYLQYLFEKYFALHDSVQILDIGCGANDNFKSYFNASDSVLINLDISHQALLALQKNINFGIVPITSKSNIIQGTTLSLPFKENCFDLVLCCQCLHYFRGDERKKSFSEIIRVCKNNGHIIVAVKNKYSLQTAGVKVLSKLCPSMFPLPFYPFTCRELKREVGQIKIMEMFSVIKIPKIDYSSRFNLFLNKRYNKSKLALRFGMDLVLIAQK
jgi:ubiquinone/menaquinone biosynthesis C-methylase UbiE